MAFWNHPHNQQNKKVWLVFQGVVIVDPRREEKLHSSLCGLVLEMAEGRDAVSIKALSLDQELSKFPGQLLNHQCFESHLAKLVHCIDTETMELMAPNLELTPVEVDDIQTAWPRKPIKQRLEMFKTWVEKNKSQATYRYMCVSATIESVIVVMS